MWVSVGRALRPVEAMRREAAVITSAHLDRRLPITPGDDEIPRLARTLNEMLDRIDASQRLQRQFVSDASHELRSPLTTLRQLAEVAQGYPGRVVTADLAADVLAEEQRMEDLVNALLVLARLDDAPAARDDRPVDLDDLVLMEARRQRNGGARIDVSGVSAGQVAGHPVLLGQAVRNLLAQRGPPRPGPGHGHPRRAATTACSWWSTTTGRASRRRSGAGCSSGSCGWTSRGPATTAAPGSASRS